MAEFIKQTSPKRKKSEGNLNLISDLASSENSAKDYSVIESESPPDLRPNQIKSQYLKSEHYTVNNKKRLHSAYSAVKVQAFKPATKKSTTALNEVPSFLYDTNVNKFMNRGNSEFIVPDAYNVTPDQTFYSRKPNETEVDVDANLPVSPSCSKLVVGFQRSLNLQFHNLTNASEARLFGKDGQPDTRMGNNLTAVRRTLNPFGQTQKQRPWTSKTNASTKTGGRTALGSRATLKSTYMLNTTSGGETNVMNKVPAASDLISMVS